MDDFREWLSDNLRYILLGCAIVLVVVVIVCVAKLAGGSSKKSDSQAQTQQAAAQEASVSSESTAAASSDLVKDDAAILALVQKYYSAVASRDTAALAAIVNPWNETTQKNILADQDIEAYDNISTYSKAGPVDGSYVVYAYFDAKLKNIATEAPSLAMLYVVTDESGNLIVSDRNSSQEVADYIKKVGTDSDVQALIQDVNDKLNAAAQTDSDLSAYLDAHRSSSSSSSSSQEQSTEKDQTSSSGSSQAASGSTATTTAGVNIRASASADGSILGVTYAGAEVTVIEKGDEWSHISFTYNGNTLDGYVSTQYLDFGDSSGDADGSSGEETTAQSDTSADASSSDGTAM